MLELALALMLYWDAPTQREDGEPFHSNEIEHYEMFYNGELYDVTNLTEMNVEGYGDFKVRVIDIDGVASDFSNVVTVSRVKGKAKAPGQLRKQR